MYADGEFRPETLALQSHHGGESREFTPCSTSTRARLASRISPTRLFTLQAR